MPSMTTGVIALLTDFGLDDHYVGVMKGVILGVNPGARLVDITHNVAPQNIREAAFLLWKSYSYFPEGTVFLCVVDPGVGGRRKPLAVRTTNHFFVGPDNGVLSLAAKEDGIEKAIALENKDYFLPDISSTFHGRDVFAPAAGHISRGVDLSLLGREVRAIKEISFPKPVIKGDILKGEVIYRDGFGNLVTNISKKTFLRFLGARKFTASLSGKKINRLVSTYEEAEESIPFFVEGGFSLLEISLKNASAADFFSCGREGGKKITVKRA